VSSGIAVDSNVGVEMESGVTLADTSGVIAGSVGVASPNTRLTDT
jgi:hypothetical protein